MNPAVIFEVFCQDLSRLGGVVLATLLLAVIPAVVLTIMAAAQTGCGKASVMLGGALRCWLVGTPAFVASWFVLTGLYGFISHTFQLFHPAFHPGCLLSLLALSVLLAAVLGYVAAARYFARAALRTGERPIFKSSVPRWRKAFTLRTFVIAQIFCLFAFSLWLAGRRDLIHSRENRRQELIWEADVHERLDGYGWNVMCPVRQTVWLHNVGSLSNFNDDVLDKILPTDGLTEIKLESEALTDAGLAKLARHPKLNRVYIDSPHVTDAGIAELVKVPSLKWLELTCEQLTGDSLIELQKVKTLSSLSIHKGKISRAAADDFRNVRPDVQFYCEPDWSEVRPKH
jgi:hypothetical protein